jgi:ribosomal protein S12 methylthiotransferase
LTPIQSDSVFIVNLGCAKNLVDANVISQILTSAGYEHASSMREAKFVIINTCGFIHDARVESQEVISDALKNRRKGQYVIASGCLSQRLNTELYAQFPGLDGLVGTRNLQDVLTLLDNLSESDKLRHNTLPAYPKLVVDENFSNTIIQGGSSYLKIADGCHRTCAFCAIPLIKGPLVSRPRESIIRDALFLQEAGVKEINLIAQDVTAYGADRGESDALADLLIDLLPQIPDVPWVRLLYTYPGMVTERLIEMMAASNQLLPYLDMPLQHADPTVLKAMSRPSNLEWVTETIAKMRRLIPNLVVRTTMIVGFPNESDKSFEILRGFVRDTEFDHLGVFTYSPEMDTPSWHLTDPIPTEVKEARMAELMELQAEISLARLKKLQGKTLDMLVEGINTEESLLVGRTYRDAPEIDGLAIAVGIAEEGDLVPIRVTNTTEYDIIGEQLQK